MPHSRQLSVHDNIVNGTSRTHLSPDRGGYGRFVDARGHGRVWLSQHGNEHFTINHVLPGGTPRRGKFGRVFDDATMGRGRHLPKPLHLLLVGPQNP